MPVQAATISTIKAAPTPLPQNAWSRVAAPTRGDTSSIGFYSNGCVAGAHTLPLDGDGYQVMRPSRNRYYGHPIMIQYVQDLAATLQAMDAPLLIGDMGQPRGGTMPYGHKSHQIGLDVDVWFWNHPEQEQRSLTLDEREKLPLLSVLNENGIVDPKKFGEKQILKLKVAAENDLVQRIFVNPAIKVYLCSTLGEGDRDWLHKLRPWPGHDEHFHVRLYCPADEKQCTHQDEQPAGDGCAEVVPHKTEIDANGTEDKYVDEQLLNQFFKPVDSGIKAMPAACAKLLKQ
ncbi:MAG: penicillin-insensitive murein endopeptidase [Bdellovibrionales bacterium]|nr:penicillin-insensitive murein endopeptidase [Bdellovibrionales bacterium]